MNELTINDLTYQSVWETLSGIDVSRQIRKKGDLSYLPWSYAWRVMMEEYPEVEYSFKPPVTREDNTVEVWVKVNIGSLSRKMWLPVMDYKGNAIKNPDTKQISNARMRALVKCFAMFGLGVYIYSGEDVPELRGQTTGQLLDFDKIKQAHAFFQAEIDKGPDGWDYQKIQDAETNIQAECVDYMTEIMGYFGTSKPKDSKRQYKNILVDILKTKLDKYGKPAFPDGEDKARREIDKIINMLRDPDTSEAECKEAYDELNEHELKMFDEMCPPELRFRIGG